MYLQILKTKRYNSSQFPVEGKGILQNKKEEDQKVEIGKREGKNKNILYGIL